MKTKTRINIVTGTIALVAMALSSAVSAQANVTFYDGLFTKNWNVTNVNVGTGGTTATAANGLGSRKTTMTVNAGTSNAVQVVHLNKAFFWHFKAQGAISTIDYSESLKTVGGQIGSGPVIVQLKNGITKVYCARYIVDTLGLFVVKNMNGLTAANFGEIRSNLYGIDMNSHPDLSVNGGILQFGYLQTISTYNTSYTREGWVDDYQLRIWPL